MAEKIALGTVQLGLAYGANNTVGLPSEQEAADIVRLAAGAGVAMLDTAHGYGLSEERIGLALQTLPAGERPWVVTKVDAACNDAGSPEEAAAIVEAGIQTSRARLQVETIDTMLLHHFRQYKDHEGAAWATLRAAKARGEITKIGCSTYEPEEVMEALSDPEVEHIQLPFNLLAEPYKTEAFAAAAAARPDVTIHVRSAYLQGILVSDRSRWPAFAVESGLADRVIATLEQLVCPPAPNPRPPRYHPFTDLPADGACWARPGVAAWASEPRRPRSVLRPRPALGLPGRPGRRDRRAAARQHRRMRVPSPHR